MSHCQSAGQNHYLKAANKSSENMAKFKYLEAIITNQSCIHEKIKSTLNSRNTCYHALQNLYKIIILPVGLNGCKTWSLTLGRRQIKNGF
jgi:hypothetical protein